ncbi:MAG TPA: peroxidase-related enzyme [Gammaproteobacteria bacterium]
MSTTVPSHFPLPDLASLPADVRERIEQVQAKAGFIPNVFLVLAHRPAEFRAFFAYHDALMEKEGGLSKAEREMIVVATSAANACEYCVIAHGALVRIYAKRPKLADQLAVNYRTADLSERERLLLDFAVQVAVDSGSVEAEDIEAMRGAGFSDDEIWDIGAISAFFAMSNRLASVTGMRANDEFYLLGRVPREKR